MFSSHPAAAEMADKVDGFIAVRMPASVKGRLEAVSGDLQRAGVTGDWQQDGTHHLTLKYIGEIESEKFDDIADGLREPCERLSLPKFTIGPLFTFRNKDETILAARVEPKKDLQRLFRVIERVVVAHGGPESEFPSFKPHVTLCYLDKGGKAVWNGGIKGELDMPDSFGEMTIVSVPLNIGDGRGSDFKIKRLVKVGKPNVSRYHAATRLFSKIDLIP